MSSDFDLSTPDFSYSRMMPAGGGGSRATTRHQAHLEGSIAAEIASASSPHHCDVGAWPVLQYFSTSYTCLIRTPIQCYVTLFD